MKPVYLDHNATTPLSGAARTAMEPYLEGQYGNPLTSHVYGAAPKAAITAARRDLLTRFGAGEAADAWRVVFNGGATEGLNHALKGIAFASLENGRASPRRRIVISALEHYAVKRPAAWLAERFGFEVVQIAPDSSGVVDAGTFLDAVDPATTLLASVHWANNEMGALQPVEAIGAQCRERGVPFVCDAVQVVGKADISAGCSFADVLAVSGHKFYGPKGVGALALRRDVAIDPLLHGANQEEGLRGGTHNVAGIVGLAAALNSNDEDRAREAERLVRLRDLLWKTLRETIQGVHWNGEGADLLPNTLNVSFDGCPSFLTCEQMDRLGFAISAGAACLSGEVKPSANILAMGLSESRARTSVRISLGHSNSERQIVTAGDAFAKAVKRVRAEA